MAKNNNKGFSLVEIIVAIAIFLILIVPITTQLIQSVKINKTSTKKQYAIEKAEAIMENFKVCTFASTIQIPDGDSSGDYTFTLDHTTPESITLPNGETATYNIDTYICNGLSLAENYEKYDCEVTVSGKSYAVSAAGYVWDEANNDFKKDGSGNYITTTSATGTIRNLDNNQFAIITGATYTGANSSVEGNNLDNKAYQYFKDEKLDILQGYNVFYSQYLAGTDYFKDDTFEKYTTIKVSYTGSKYLVQCIVEYVDQPVLTFLNSDYVATGRNRYKPETTYADGVVYQQEFDVLPPIYLLYMPAIYNGQYCKTDYIQVDTSGLAASDEAKIYIFESVADVDSDYKSIICDYFGVNDLDDLVYSNPDDKISQSSVKVRVNLAGGSTNDNFDVYTNFTVDQANSDIPVKSTSEDDNNDVYLYDIHVTLTDSEGNKTEISGTRGKK